MKNEAVRAASSTVALARKTRLLAADSTGKMGSSAVMVNVSRARKTTRISLGRNMKTRRFWRFQSSRSVVTWSCTSGDKSTSFSIWREQISIYLKSYNQPRNKFSSVVISTFKYLPRISRVKHSEPVLPSLMDVSDLLTLACFCLYHSAISKIPTNNFRRSVYLAEIRREGAEGDMQPT